MWAQRAQRTAVLDSSGGAQPGELERFRAVVRPVWAVTYHDRWPRTGLDAVGARVDGSSLTLGTATPALCFDGPDGAAVVACGSCRSG